MIDRTVSVRFTQSRLLISVAVVQALFIVFLGLAAVGIEASFARAGIAFVYLTFVPGALAAVLLRLEDSPLPTLVAYIVGLSLSIVMTVGAITSLIYPPLGIERPLSELPLVLTLLGVVIVLAIVGMRNRADFELDLPVGRLFSPLPLALLLLPFVSIFGTVLQDVQGTNVVLVAMLIVIAGGPVLAALWRRESEWYALAVWVIGTALLYHGGLWPFTGGHPSMVMTLQNGVWLPNAEDYGSILPNAVLFPIYAILVDVSTEVEWAVINPLLVSVLPVALFQAFRGQISDRRAFIGTCLFMFSFPFSTLYPGAGRVATPVLYLALIGVAATDGTVRTVQRQFLLLIFGVSLAVSHYGTAYVAMIAFIIAVGSYFAISVVESLLNSGDIGRALNSLRAPLRSDGSGQQRLKLLRLSFITYYSSIALAWYLYTAQGTKFGQLPRKVIDAVEGVIYIQAGGSAANVVTKQYGSEIVATSRQMYLLLGALMATGFVAVVVRRVLYQERAVDDEYLALAVGFFAIFGGSALPSGTGFAIARVMMIIFVFAAPFVVFGTEALFDALQWVLDRKNLSLYLQRGPTVSAAVGVVLAVFLLFNSGVVATIVGTGYSPSTKIEQQRLLNSNDPLERAKATACVECNVETHAWVVNHRDPNVSAYGDEFVESQTDFYAPQIQSKTGESPGPNYYNSIRTLPNGTNGSAYAVLLKSNLDTNGVYETKYKWYPMGRLSGALNSSSLVYTTGSNEIYMVPSQNSSVQRRQS